MRTLISMLIFLACSVSLWALPVTQGKAKQWALDFFESNKSLSRSANISLDMVWDGEDNASRSGASPAFYVFNRTDNKGFVVVAGDDEVSPLIGYSFENRFCYDNLPENIRLWFEDVKNEIAAVRRLPGSRSVAQVWQSKSSLDTGDVLKLWPTALWNQDEPYNRVCPIDPKTNTRSVTGCAATALAIAMRGYEWPSQGIGSLPAYSYTASDNTTVTMPTRSVEHIYNWDAMPLEVDVNTTDEQKKHIAELMLDCGYMAECVYSSNSTGGVLNFAIDNLRDNFKYSSSINIIDRNHYSNKEWEAMMKKELDRDGQIVYGGQSPSGGHGFVLYGYTSKDYFAVNWGWGGFCNGYFKLTQLNPDDQGIGGSVGGYNHYQNAIINMKAKTAQVPALQLYTLMGMYSDGMKNDWGIKTTAGIIDKNVDVDVVWLANFGPQKFEGQLAYCLFGADNEMKCTVGGIYNDVQFKVNTAGSLGTETLTIPESAVAGDYIALGEKETGAMSFTPIRGDLNSISRLEIGSFDHALKDDKVALVKGTQHKESSYGLRVDRKSIEKNVGFTLTADVLMNISKEMLNGEVKVGLYNRNHELQSVVSTNSIKLNNLKPITKYTNSEFTCKITTDILPGDYLSLCYSADNGTSWQRVRALDNLLAHIDLLKTHDVLTKGTSLEYDILTGYITVINNLPDEYYVLKDKEGKVIQEGSGNQPFVIDTNQLTPARYALWVYLTKNSEEKVSINLKCGKNLK